MGIGEALRNVGRKIVSRFRIEMLDPFQYGDYLVIPSYPLLEPTAFGGTVTKGELRLASDNVRRAAEGVNEAVKMLQSGAVGRGKIRAFVLTARYSRTFPKPSWRGWVEKEEKIKSVELGEGDLGKAAGVNIVAYRQWIFTYKLAAAGQYLVLETSKGPVSLLPLSPQPLNASYNEAVGGASFRISISGCKASGEVAGKGKVEALAKIPTGGWIFKHFTVGNTLFSGSGSFDADLVYCKKLLLVAYGDAPDSGSIRYAIYTLAAKVEKWRRLRGVFFGAPTHIRLSTGPLGLKKLDIGLLGEAPSLNA